MDDIGLYFGEHAAVVGIPSIGAIALGGALGEPRGKVAHGGQLNSGQRLNACEVLTGDLPGSDQGGLHGVSTAAADGLRSMIRAGTPTAVDQGGTSQSTTLMAPTFAP